MSRKHRLIISFDVPNAQPGDPRYARVDRLLKEKGELRKVFKQLRLVTTSALPSEIAPEISRIIGNEGAVLISQGGRPYRFVFGKNNRHAGLRKRVEAWFRASSAKKKPTVPNPRTSLH